MPWTYEIASGRLWNDGYFYARGYSGAPGHVNNTDDQALVNLGPLPEGDYTLEAPIDSEKLGPLAIPLVPDETNQMYGRSGFFIHGDSKEHPGLECASEGCPIFSSMVRQVIAKGIARGDNRLRVVARIPVAVTDTELAT